MKITLFNDTRVDWSLHIGSEYGVNGEQRIPKGGHVTFEAPDDHDVFVKVWGRMAMVRFAEEAAVPRRPPRPKSPRPKSLESRQCILCGATIPDDGGIDVCGRCIVERQ
jgi:hypothetical protein